MSENKPNRKFLSASVNQIRALTTTEHGLVIHRQKIHLCCIVGNVLAINDQATKTLYMIRDYTDKEIEVVMWKNSEELGRATNSTIIEQTYIRAYGKPQRNGEELHFVAYSIQPLRSLNEITIHLLEVVAHAKDLLKLKNQLQAGNLVGGNPVGTSLLGANPMGGNPVGANPVGGNSVGSQAVSGVGGGPGTPKTAGFTEIQSLVLDLIKSDSSDMGISLETICNALRTLKKEIIKETLDFLENAGFIYTALDDVHFKSSY